MSLTAPQRAAESTVAEVFHCRERVEEDAQALQRGERRELLAGLNEQEDELAIQGVRRASRVGGVRARERTQAPENRVIVRQIVDGRARLPA